MANEVIKKAHTHTILTRNITPQTFCTLPPRTTTLLSIAVLYVAIQYFPPPSAIFATTKLMKSGAYGSNKRPCPSSIWKSSSKSSRLLSQQRYCFCWVDGWYIWLWATVPKSKDAFLSIIWHPNNKWAMMRHTGRMQSAYHQCVRYHWNRTMANNRGRNNDSMFGGTRWVALSAPASGKSGTIDHQRACRHVDWRHHRLRLPDNRTSPYCGIGVGWSGWMVFLRAVFHHGRGQFWLHIACRRCLSTTKSVARSQF